MPSTTSNNFNPRRPQIVEEGSAIGNDLDGDISFDFDDGEQDASIFNIEPSKNNQPLHSNGSSFASATKPKIKSRLTTRLVVGNTSSNSLRSNDMQMQVSAPIFQQQQPQEQPIIPKYLSTTIAAAPPKPIQLNTMMEVDQIEEPTTPLIVIDGANIAHGYSSPPSISGILLAVNYFLSHSLHTTVVLPTHWMRRKPRSTDTNSENALMLTNELELLQELHARHLICCSPSGDDDDAYMLSIARHAEKVYKRGYIVSCDLFRDALHRDRSLEPWLKQRRISYAFCTVGNDVLFVPNPKHDLIVHLNSSSNGSF